MFGYVKADISKLGEEDLALYRACYCALCNSLKKHYGVSSRFLLNYDVTFLAILKLSLSEKETAFEQKYCPYKAKKCSVVTGAEEIFFECASVLIILAYEKILDNIRDEKWFKKLFYFFVSLVFKRKYLKAKKEYPVLSDKIRQNMIIQEKTEKQKPSLDKSAHPTADSLGNIFDADGKNEKLYYFGYCIGRWIYFIDAADDLEKDRLSGSFNPFLSGYSDEKITQVLNLSIGEAAAAFKNISAEKNRYTNLLKNIIYEGTNLSQLKVFGGREN